MTNTNELTAKLKAAAERVVDAYGDEWFEAGRQICTVHKSKIHLISLSSPENILELIAALEAAQKRNAELEESHKKLRDAMAVIHNTIRLDGLNAPLAAIMSRAKRAHEESAAAAGINLETGGE